MPKLKETFFANAWLTDTRFSSWVWKSSNSLKLTANDVKKTEILSRRSVFTRPLVWSHVHSLRNNFLVQIVRSLSEEGRVFFKKKKNSSFDFNRLILLFEWESVAKLVIIFALAPDGGRLMWVKIVKLLFWCCCYYISWRTL